jgi:hypothetical protein
MGTSTWRVRARDKNVVLVWPRERDAGSGTKQDMRADGKATGARIMRVGADMLWPAATVWTRHADAESPARHGKGGVARRVLDEMSAAA